MWFKTFLVEVLCIFLINSYVECTHNIVSVRLKNGDVLGRVDSSTGLTTFLGIPYAQPPIGWLRFRKPFPVEPWSQPKQALEWPRPCYQHHPFPNTFKNQEWSEDCLYLNIWSPHDVKKTEDELRPVMFWIHGGALIVGSSAEEWYNGAVLALEGDVVVVTINYRLSKFDKTKGVRNNENITMINN